MRCVPTAGALVVLLAGTSAAADVYVLDHQLAVDSTVIRVDSATDADTVVGVAPHFPLATDLQVAPDGYLYFALGGASSALVRAHPDLSGMEIFSPIAGVMDVALDRSGALLAVDRHTPIHPASGLFEISLDGARALLDTIPGFNMISMDVLHAGPFADGVLVTGYEATPPNEHYLYRYRRLPDGRLDREGPFGPLEATAFLTCASAWGANQRHVATMASGMSFLTVEPCSGRVLEHDTEGNFLRTFAVVEDDPTVHDPTNPTAVYDDHLTAVHVTAEGDVYVSTRKRLYHFTFDGTLVRKLDREFRLAYALGEAVPVGFVRDAASCRAAGVGYWKRQCLARGIGFSRGSGRSHPRLSGAGLHPSFRDGRLADLLSRVTRDLEPYEISACEALWPQEASAWRGKALMRLAALYLDIEDGRLGMDCTVSADGTDIRVRDGLREVVALISEDTQESLREACRLVDLFTGGAR